MDKTACVYAGTFDPPTYGHIALIRKAQEVFDFVNVVIAVNPEKVGQHVIPPVRRRNLFQKVLEAEGLPMVEVAYTKGNVGDWARKQTGFWPPKFFVRGIRTASDLEAEMNLLRLNEKYFPEMKTVFLAPDEHLAHVSSSYVKQLWLNQPDWVTEDWRIYLHPLIQPVFNKEMTRIHGARTDGTYVA